MTKNMYQRVSMINAEMKANIDVDIVFIQLTPAIRGARLFARPAHVFLWANLNGFVMSFHLVLYIQ